MARLVAMNAAVLISIGALMGAFAETNCEVDGTCQAEQGEVLLQHRQSTKRKLATELSEKRAGKKSGKKAAALSGSEPAFHIGGVPVYGAQPLALEESMPPHPEKRDWIIMLKDDATEEEEHAFCTFHGLQCAVEGHPDHGGVPFVELSLTDSELEALIQEHEGRVEFVEAVTTVQLIPELPNDPNGADYAESGSLLEMGSSTSYPWGITRVRADQSRGEGDNVHVYVLDTGVNIQHSDFEGRAKAGLDMTNNVQDVCSPDNTTCARDNHGHGTHCAGTIAGKVYGVASDAFVYGVKVLSDSGSGYTHWIVGAIDWVVSSGSRPAVISMSLGGSGTSQSYKTAINAATNQGVTVVVAAGNENDDACGYSPAYVPSAITVGSTTSQDTRSWFSNYGECIQMFAPGSNIRSAAHNSNTGVATKSGTSMACPHVAGAAAWLLGKNSQMTPSQILEKFKEVGDHGLIQDTKCGTYNLMLTLSETGNSGPDVPAPTCAPTPACANSDDGASDPYGDGCDAYTSNPGWCGPGKYEDDDFTNTLMCCACGGGNIEEPAPTPVPTTTSTTTTTTTTTATTTTTGAPTTTGAGGSCSDTDNGAEDPYGDDCADYTSNPGWCGPNQYDDGDFSNSVMCCTCGGGSSGGGPAPSTAAPSTGAPTTGAPTTTGAGGSCSDTDDGAEDPYGDDCSDYANYPSWCGPNQFDDEDFSNSVMCCTCGGGTTGGSGGAYTPPTPAPTALGCSDADNGAEDPWGDDCTDYANHPSWCVPDDYDDDDFSNQVMCCACGGGESSVLIQAESAKLGKPRPKPSTTVGLAQASAKKAKKAGKPRPKPSTTVGLAQVGARRAKMVKRDRHGKPRVKKE